jgi:hypothetical protein
MNHFDRDVLVDKRRKLSSATAPQRSAFRTALSAVRRTYITYSFNYREIPE